MYYLSTAAWPRNEPNFGSFLITVKGYDSEAEIRWKLSSALPKGFPVVCYWKCCNFPISLSLTYSRSCILYSSCCTVYIIYVVMTQQLHSHDGGTRRVLDSAFCAFCRVRFAARGSGGLIMVQQESGKKKLRCLFPDLGS